MAEEPTNNPQFATVRNNSRGLPRWAWLLPIALATGSVIALFVLFSFRTKSEFTEDSRDRQQPGITKENFDRIQIDMPKVQVDAILGQTGKRADEWGTKDGVHQRLAPHYRYSDAPGEGITIEVWFDLEPETRVTAMKFRQSRP